MSGGLNVGDVYVVVSASIGSLQSSMANALKTVEQTAKKMKEAAKGVAEVGTLFAAGMAGAIAASAQSNRAIAADLERLKAYLYTLAADVGDAFGPFLRDVTNAVGSVVGAFQRLSPEAKKSLAHFVAFMASVGGGAAILSKGAGLVEGVAKAAGLVLVPALGAATKAAVALEQASFKAFPAIAKAVAGMEEGVLRSTAKMAASFAATLLPVVAVAAALAAVTLAAGALYGVWSRNSGLIREDILTVVGVLESWVETLTHMTMTGLTVVANAGQSLLHTVMGVAGALLDILTSNVRSVAGLLGSLAEGAGMSGIAKGLKEIAAAKGAALLTMAGSTARAGLSVGIQSATNGVGMGLGLAGGGLANSIAAADAALYGLKQAASDTGKMFSDAVKATGLDKAFSDLKEKVSGVFGGAPNIRSKFGKRDDPYTRFSKNAEALSEYANATDAKRFAISERAEEDQLARSLEAIDEENRREKELADLQAEASEEAAEEMRKALVADYRSAAEATKAIADEARALAQEMADRIADARQALTAKLWSALGKVGDLIDSFQQGMTAAGPLGGLASVGLDLLMQSDGFQDTMKVVDSILQKVADALGMVLQPLQPLLGALFAIIDAGLPLLAPLFDMLARIIEPLAPPLIVVAQLLAGLVPVLTLLEQVVLLIINPMQMLAGPVLQALFNVLKFVSKVILEAVRGIAGVWNGIVGAVQTVFRKLADISVFGAHPLGFLDDWADKLQGAMIDTDALAASLQALNNLTWDTAKAKAEEIAQTLRNTEAMQKVNEQLTNLPRGFKLNLERYRAQDALTSVPLPTTPPPLPSSGGATQGGRPPRPGVETNPVESSPGITIGNFTITGVDPDKTVERARKELENLAIRFFGNRRMVGVP